jgi:hypothetical protein
MISLLTVIFGASLSEELIGFFFLAEQGPLQQQRHQRLPAV